MAVFTVHTKGDQSAASALEQTVFVRDGFSWSAFLFGPFWLAFHRLWLALIGWFVLSAAFMAFEMLLVPREAAASALEFLLALLLGFEGAQLRRWVLGRRGYRFAGVTSGRRLGDAERSFFERTIAPQPGIPLKTGVPGRPQTPNMVGLFPSAGSGA